ncbi:MAG: hypothetical protein H6P99_1997 [Holophagaceae bacterium]|nr:hypothetical protein [Holophagaceae bacterium]
MAAPLCLCARSAVFLCGLRASVVDPFDPSMTLDLSHPLR